jgi:hypothetical protein
MTEKLRKGSNQRLHPRSQRSRRHRAWRKAVTDGMRAAKIRRRDAGMMTFTEVALELVLPLYGIKHMVAAGQLQAVEAGPKKRYIRRDEVERWKRENGASEAA